MAIRGIDNQMMITRTAELAKEAGSQLKRNELMQDYLAVQAKALAQQEGKKVAETVSPQEVVIHRDKREKEGGSRSDSEAEQQAQAAAEEQEEEQTPTSLGTHTIDIKI